MLIDEKPIIQRCVLVMSFNICGTDHQCLHIPGKHSYCPPSQLVALLLLVILSFTRLLL